MIPSKNARATKAAARETTTAVPSELPSTPPGTGERPFDANAAGSIPTGRRCVDLNGHTFGWNWPNIPFGAAACSDADRKTDK
jgi:hypothetical protein